MSCWVLKIIDGWINEAVENLYENEMIMHKMRGKMLFKSYLR